MVWVSPADVGGVAEVAPAQAHLALDPPHPRQVEQLGGAALLQPGQQRHPGAAPHTHLPYYSWTRGSAKFSRCPEEAPTKLLSY